MLFGLSFDMKLEHYPKEKLKREILDIVGRHLDLTNYRVFFFGSRVGGGHTDRSDIDVGIEGPSPIPLEKMARIRGDIEDLPTLYHIDVVDFRTVDESFREVAMKHVEALR